MHHHHNIYAYPWGDCWMVAGGKPGTAAWAGGSGFNDAFVNNTCVPIGETSGTGYMGDCGTLPMGM